MNKFKNLVGWLALLWTVATSNAQQVLKKLTQNTNDTTVELFTLKHGNDANNVTWPSWFDTLLSDWSVWIVIHNNIDPNNIYYRWTWSNNITYPSIPNENIWSAIFETPGNADSRTTNWYTNPLNSSQTINISIPKIESNWDAISDWNTNIDLLKSKVILPKTLNDWSPVPTWTWILLLSRTWIDGITWGVSINSKRMWLQFNWNQREIKSQDWNWINFDSFSDSTLWTNEFNYNKNTVKAYPNPTTESISFDNWDNINETSDFKVIDFSGKIVIEWTANENEKINVSHLPKGMYFLHSKNDNSVTNNKFIKN